MDEPKSVISWPDIMNPPSREVVCEIIEGENADVVANTLVDKILAEKVL